MLKAVAYSRASDLPTLADDSGIEVTALGGAPGIHSARFGGDGLNDKNRNDLLLRQLEAAATVDRSARYVCVLALARGGELVTTFEATVEGTIAQEPCGDGGFGYDPLFFYPPFGKTFGEVSAGEKDGVSHRGKAFRAFLEYARLALPKE
jgi:XTP/dITP diphosphohydrolase